MCAIYMCSDGFKTNKYENFIAHLMAEEERGVFDEYPKRRDELAERYSDQISELDGVEQVEEEE